MCWEHACRIRGETEHRGEWGLRAGVRRGNATEMRAGLNPDCVGQVDGPSPKGETKARRCPDFKDQLQWLPYPDDAACNTPTHVLLKAKDAYVSLSPPVALHAL